MKHLNKTNMKEFFKQIMLFKSKDRIDIILGLGAWFCTISIFLIIIILAYLINLINN